MENMHEVILNYKPSKIWTAYFQNKSYEDLSNKMKDFNGNHEGPMLQRIFDGDNDKDQPSVRFAEKCCEKQNKKKFPIKIPQIVDLPL